LSPPILYFLKIQEPQLNEYMISVTGYTMSLRHDRMSYSDAARRAGIIEMVVLIVEIRRQPR